MFLISLTALDLFLHSSPTSATLPVILKMLWYIKLYLLLSNGSLRSGPVSDASPTDAFQLPEAKSDVFK